MTTSISRDTLAIVRQIADKLSNKVLIQIEGATCSGKSSFVYDIATFFQRKGFCIMILEEAARKIFKKNINLIEKLRTHANEDWKRIKIEIQQEILMEQLESLSYFAKDKNYKIAIMDRGGASTAYHTLPWLPDNKHVVEEVCKEIAKMANLVILLPPLGFLIEDTFRYQKDIKEIKFEYEGIKQYLDKWKINYLESNSTQRSTRIRTAIRHVLPILSKTCNMCSSKLRRF